MTQMSMNKTRLVIEKSGVKRELNFPFAICGDREALQYLAKAIDATLARDAGFSYGWIEILSPYENHCIPNSKPIPWEAASN